MGWGTEEGAPARLCPACDATGIATPSVSGGDLPLCAPHAQEWLQFALTAPALFTWVSRVRREADQAHRDRQQWQREWAEREAQFITDRAAFESTIAALLAQLQAIRPLIARAATLLAAADELFL